MDQVITELHKRATMAEVERDLARAECARLQAELTTARALVKLEIAEKYGVPVERCAEQSLKTEIKACEPVPEPKWMTVQEFRKAMDQAIIDAIQEAQSKRLEVPR